MTQLLTNIKQAESCCLHGYPDPRSPLGEACQSHGINPIHFRNLDSWVSLSGSPWTVGYGQTGPGIGPSTIWTQGRAEAALQASLNNIISQLNKITPWWEGLDSTRRDAFAELAYNLGVSGWVRGFPDTIKLIQNKDYQGAADNLSVSSWSKQVGKTRAQRIITMIREG